VLQAMTAFIYLFRHRPPPSSVLRPPSPSSLLHLQTPTPLLCPHTILEALALERLHFVIGRAIVVLARLVVVAGMAALITAHPEERARPGRPANRDVVGGELAAGVGLAVIVEVEVYLAIGVGAGDEERAAGGEEGGELHFLSWVGLGMIEGM
jgi:hypothetical protein